MPHYARPTFMTTRVANPLLSLLVRMGISPRGAQILSVRGRKTGEWRSTPVNPLQLNGQRYLVAPRGETQWVRNLRAGGEARLTVGRRATTIQAEELADRDKPPILREYLKRWRAETGKFFGVGESPSDEDLVRIAPEHPVFRIDSRG